MRTPALLLSLIILGCGTTRQGVKLSEEQEKPPKVFYKGGDGNSYETAVVIDGAKNHRTGVEAEHTFISRTHGEKDKAWRIVSQSLSKEENRTYDIVEIELIGTGVRQYYYFDLTSSSWQPKE